MALLLKITKSGRAAGGAKSDRQSLAAPTQRSPQGDSVSAQ
ncbi:hypothetical protein R2A130_2376 [Ahrensia sp. R2A130]|nr:hypothetical protein R2A130_2376 [Ahrensia sp. R2A130]